MRRWWWLLLLSLLLAGLQWKLWRGQGGMSEARALQEQVSAQRAENEQLQQRNDALSAEVEDLKSGEAAVEERARSELGMTKPGETFYRVVEPPAPDASAPAAGEEGAEPGAPAADAVDESP